MTPQMPKATTVHLQPQPKVVFNPIPLIAVEVVLIVIFLCIIAYQLKENSKK